MGALRQSVRRWEERGRRKELVWPMWLTVGWRGPGSHRWGKVHLQEGSKLLCRLIVLWKEELNVTGHHGKQLLFSLGKKMETGLWVWEGFLRELSSLLLISGHGIEKGRLSRAAWPLLLLPFHLSSLDERKTWADSLYGLAGVWVPIEYQGNGQFQIACWWWLCSQDAVHCII